MNLLNRNKVNGNRGNAESALDTIATVPKCIHMDLLTKLKNFEA